MSLRLEKRPTVSTTNLEEVNKNNVTEKRKNNISILEKIRMWIMLITVEPALFAYLFATTFAGSAADKLQVEMACRVNLELNDTLCSNYTLGIYYTATKMVQTETWIYNTKAVIGGILVLCFSTYSDRHKLRKPFFVLPIFGEVLSCVGLILCVIFLNIWPVELFFIFAYIIPVCFGGGNTLIVAINSYIADISTIEERTTRVGFVELVSLILAPVGPILGAVLFPYIGYYGTLVICGLLFLIGTLYAWFYIPEKRDSVVAKNTCIDVFNIKAVIIDMVKILVRKRIRYRRCLLLSVYICYIMMNGISVDGRLLKYYAATEFKIDNIQYQYFKSFDIIVHILGLLLAITIFLNKLKVPDLMLVVIACCFKIISSLWFAFGKSLVMLYIGPLISMFTGIYIIALRSLVTKLVSQSEVAKAQALFAICEMIIPLIYNVNYQKFYEATKIQYPGAFFLLSAVLVIPPLILALIMNAVYKNDLKEEEKTKGTNDESNGNQEQGVYNEGNDIESSKL